MQNDMTNLMKKAQEMQEKISNIHKELADIKVVGYAGGDMVSVTMNGRHNAKHVTIDPSLLKGCDEDAREFLEDLLTAAINDAVNKVESKNQNKMTSVASELQMPSDLNFSL